ncbi:GPX3 Glutathione peroxidase-like peroxiredoxin GPX3 [Candida maltosa Xu316]
MNDHEPVHHHHQQPQHENDTIPKIYTFQIPDANNTIINFREFQNKVIIIVNVATLCGFTPQYKDLQLLYDRYHDQGLEILGFPCNQFGNQEPFKENEIIRYCHKNYGVTFPIMKKIRVNGDAADDEEASELYTYLKNEKAGVLGFKGVRWNFEKFIINRKGEVVARFGSLVTPLQFEDYLKQLLE